MGRYIEHNGRGAIGCEFSWFTKQRSRRSKNLPVQMKELVDGVVNQIVPCWIE